MKKALFLFFISGICLAGRVYAQQGVLNDEALKKANDPLAKSKVINLHNYTVTNIYGYPEFGQNMLMLRYGQPFGKMLLRGTLPLLTSWGPASGPQSGLGDLSLFGIYTFDNKGVKFGFGPMLTAPTGTNNLSSEKWQAGAVAMVFIARSRLLQSGALLQWQTSFAGKADAADINMLTSQLFGILQIDRGAYLRSTGVWSFDLENGHYNIPLGLGMGKVVLVNKVMLNIFAEPQVSVLSKGAGQARFQVFAGINTQF